MGKGPASSFLSMVDVAVSYFLLLVMGKVAVSCAMSWKKAQGSIFLVYFFDMSLPHRCLRFSHEARRVLNPEPLQFNNLHHSPHRAVG